ncbi:MAG TPA: acyloxyacyl hydrolase [Thermoanaerobaculia bacterium]
MLTALILNVHLSAGENPMNRHGHSVFHSIHFEVVAGRWRSSDVGATITYSKVRQARSWFGYRDGDPDDHVRAESLVAFIRRENRHHAYVELATGPMWSNRRIPAATSRLNFDSQIALGIVAFPNSRNPLRLGYRFSHISNGGLAGRNPGINVNSIFLGMRVKKFGAPPGPAAPP